MGKATAPLGLCRFPQGWQGAAGGGGDGDASGNVRTVMGMWG